MVVSHVSGTEKLCRRHVPVGEDTEAELKRSLLRLWAGCSRLSHVCRDLVAYLTIKNIYGVPKDISHSSLFNNTSVK